MSADKYPSIFSRQLEAIVYLSSYITRFLDLCPQPQVRDPGNEVAMPFGYMHDAR